MSRLLGCLRAAGLSAVVSLGACASSGPPEAALVIGEVLRVLTPTQVANGLLAPGHERAHLADWVRDRGLSEADVEAGRAITVRHALHGVPQDVLSLAQIDNDLKVEVGNVVEVRVDATGKGHVARVRATDLVAGGCHYEAEPAGLLDDVLGFISLRGARDVAVLRCQGLEAEGWTKTPGHFWIKAPGVGQRSDAAAPAPAGRVVQPPPPPAGIPARNDLATLILIRRDDPYTLSMFDVTFLIDGRAVAELPPDRCELVLLAPGEHEVTAGYGYSLIGHARRELSVTVRAGDRLVAEYEVHTPPQGGPFDVFSASKRKEASQKTFVFTQRPAGAGDRCAVMHPPRIIGPAPAASGTQAP
jgi:hypothetical protein